MWVYAAWLLSDHYKKYTHTHASVVVKPCGTAYLPGEWHQHAEANTPITICPDAQLDSVYQTWTWTMIYGIYDPRTFD